MKSVVLATNTPPQTQAIVSQVLLLCFYEITVQKEAHSLLWLLFQNDQNFTAICSAGSAAFLSVCVMCAQRRTWRSRLKPSVRHRGVGEILKYNTKKNRYVL